METRPTDMVNEVATESDSDSIRSKPEVLLSIPFITSTILENADDLAVLIKPILMKSIGLAPMTVEERGISDLFYEESLTPDDD